MEQTEQIKEIEQFIKYLIAERNYSDNTARAYSIDMYEFANFVKKNKNVDLTKCDIV